MTVTAWLLLIFSLPAQHSSARMRIWRSLKALGCATLRDGVVLLPLQPTTEAACQHIVTEIGACEGSSWLLHLPADQVPSGEFQALFDRTNEYAQLIEQLQALANQLDGADLASLHKQQRGLRRQFEALAGIDYFPGEAQQQTRQRLEVLQVELAARLSPDEPSSSRRGIPQLLRKEYQGRLWATRADLWVDRVASAWLIRQHIDRKAQFLWLAKPADCPADALGFDFDGATFTHVGHRVSFETLLAAFGLETDVALARLGSVIHALDAGGIIPAEAGGLEAVLRGLKRKSVDDDQFLKRATPVFDALHASFNEE